MYGAVPVSDVIVSVTTRTCDPADMPGCLKVKSAKPSGAVGAGIGVKFVLASCANSSVG